MASFCCFGLIFSVLSITGAFGSDVCIQEQKGGIDWILQERQPDYGWNEHTHRANIALAVAKHKEQEVEMRRMELRLESELTKMLITYDASLMHESDLALFVHALLARNKNPRDFHGFDLVADLLRRVNGANSIHPFLVLALCNAGAVEDKHLLRIKDYILPRQKEDGYLTEMKAIALKAFVCAADHSVNFKSDIKTAVSSLISKQNQTDGSFGNAYTTALVVQSLIASGTKEKWSKSKALSFLKQESLKQVNMIKTYLIIMAEHAVEVKFIKDLFEGKIIVSQPKTVPDSHFIKIVVAPQPKLQYSMAMEVPKAWNALQILKSYSEFSDRFNFTWFLNTKNHRAINSIAGIPNDAEENLFWIMCLDRFTNGRPVIEKYIKSPETYVPSSGDAILFNYGFPGCSFTNQNTQSRYSYDLH